MSLLDASSQWLLLAVGKDGTSSRSADTCSAPLLEPSCQLAARVLRRISQPHKASDGRQDEQLGPPATRSVHRGRWA